MQTNQTIEPLQPKTWQLDAPSKGPEGYLYYCQLCDEALVLSREEVNPRKIKLVFDDTCPGCGFQLESVIGGRASILPAGRRLLTNLKCIDPKVFLEPEPSTDLQTPRGSTFPRGLEPQLTTGIESIDETLVLKRGQFVYLQGEQAHSLSLLLSVRATLPTPPGLDSDVVFIDAGNLFDSYAISQHSINLGLENEKVQKRIHLSRAFTHHQVYSLIMDKLVLVAQEQKAGLAVISDIGALFCDPDVREKKRSIDIFHRSVRFLADTAQKRNMVIIATNLKTRNRTMEDHLHKTAHVSASIEENDNSTKLKVAKHPFIHEKTDEVILDYETLPGYFR